MEKLIFLCSFFLVFNSNCCNQSAMHNRQEPENLEKYHSNWWRTESRMPKSVENMDFLLKSYLSRPCESTRNEDIWNTCDMWICGEIAARLKDQDTYFIDTYLGRFDQLMQWASMEKYSEMMSPLFHRGPYNAGLVDHLWRDICLVRLNNPNISKEIIFRVMKGLDTSLRRVPVYIKDYVEKNADLMWCYNTMIAGNDFGPDSEVYKQISKIVEDMLIGGIPLNGESK